ANDGIRDGHVTGVQTCALPISAYGRHRTADIGCRRKVMTTPMSDVTQPQAGTRPMSAFDQFGRKIEYLRISVTDRCNFRCLYCMPIEGLQWLPKADILSYEEIANVVAQLAPLGLRRLRITGGEPTIRPNLDELIRMLRGISFVEDIALSTN